MPAENEPFPMPAEFRQSVIDALGKLLTSDVPADVLKACELVIDLDRINIQATRGSLPGPASPN